MMRISSTITVIIRDDAPMIHCGDSPSYRTVRIELAPEQVAQIMLRRDGGYESISRVIIEPESE